MQVEKIYISKDKGDYILLRYNDYYFTASKIDDDLYILKFDVLDENGFNLRMKDNVDDFDNMPEEVKKIYAKPLAAILDNFTKNIDKANATIDKVKRSTEESQNYGY